MMKNCLLFVALLSLALAGGCAKGGNGVIPPSPSITVAITSPADTSNMAIYPTQSLTLTATVMNEPTTAVTWSLTGPGTLTPVAPATNPATAIYVAPATVGSPATITATLVADSSLTGDEVLTLVDITTDVAPSPTAPSTLSVGTGLTQQFTAVAVPDAAPQTFTWSCKANGVTCANFHQDSNISGLAYYTATAQDSCGGSCVQISALSTLDPTGCSANCTIAKASLVASRVSGTYAFRFSGYDSNNNVTAVVGTFTASANGTITSGVEDTLSANGPSAHPIAITGGSYVPTSSDQNNSNNAGTLTLTTGAFPDKFQVVLDGNGDIEMIESDGHGSGSGIAQLAASPTLLKGNQTYAFGFTGVDSGGNRSGFAGVLPLNGTGGVVGGQMDVNDNGNNTNICASPCSVTGTYTADSSVNGLWHMILTAGSVNMNFDFFISSGTANKTTPLTFYAISTGPVDTTHPAVSGTMVLQDSSQTYNLAAFKGTSVSALTGANANVSLTLGATDGKGGFTGNFDQNNNGTIVSVTSTSPFSYTYAASSTTTGRYTFNMLGNPNASPAVPALPFVLYASGQNRGFLLDQSSAVIMGTMNPQGKIPNPGGLSATELPGTFAAASTETSDSNVNPVAANLLFTSPGGAVYNVSGTQYPGPPTITGAYTLSSTGTGTVALTAPSTQNYVIYVVDTAGCSNTSPVCAVLDFFMMDVDKTVTNASILFAKE